MFVHVHNSSVKLSQRTVGHIAEKLAKIPNTFWKRTFFLFLNFFIKTHENINIFVFGEIS
jgi:hypothetical protein